MKAPLLSRSAMSPLTRSSLVACASLCAIATSALAADGTWTGTVTNGNWSDIANWNSGAGPIADGSGSTADFSTLNLPAGAFTVNLDASRMVGNINFGDTDTATAGTWALAGATTLTLAGTTPTITTGVSTTISPIIDGAAGLTKAGSGILSLNAANIYTGGTFLNAGKLTLRNSNAAGAASNPITAASGTTIRIENSAFPSNPVTLSGANANLTLEWGGNGGIGMSFTGTADQKVTIGPANPNLSSSAKQFLNFLGSVDVPSGTTLQFRATSLNNGGDNATFNVEGAISTRNNGAVALGSLNGSGTLTMGTSGSNNANVTYTIGAKGENTTFSGLINDGDTANGKRVAITKTGAGSLTLSNASLNYTGSTTVNGGSLNIIGTKVGAGNTAVNNGGTLSGTGSLAGTTTVNSGGALSPGDPAVAAGIGNLTLSNLTLASGSTLNLQFGAGNDTATVAAGGTLTLNTGATVDVNGFGTDGTYTIINTTGAAAVNGNASTALSVVNGAGGKIYTFAATANAIQMTISGTDPSNYWNVDGDGTWNLAGNWTKGTIPNASGAIARIGPGVGGQGGIFSPLSFAITMDANRTVGTLSLDDAFDTVVTIEPGASGSLSFDNGANPSLLSDVAGNHIINAPVAVDADDLTVDINGTYSLTVNGTVSGSGATLTKTGSGTLVLAGTNSYDGGTILNGGAISISSTDNLGNASGALGFSGGTLRLGTSLTGVTRSYQVIGASNAQIDTNGNDFGYGGVISPVGGATGGLSKSGNGVLTLSAAQTYTGTTAVSGGGLNFPAGSSANGTNINLTGASNLTVMGGSVTASVASTITGAALNLTSGSVTLNGGLNANTGNPNSNYNIHLTSGTFDSGSITMGRGSSIINNPTAGSTTFGLYIDGATANITGSLNLGNGGNTNSSVSARIDSGSLTVSSTVLLQVNSPDRWTVFDVNGGTFTSTDAVTGIQIGSSQIGSSAFLVRNGTATAERIFLTQTAASTETSRLNLTGGSLYVGSGGILGNNNGGTGVIDVQLGGGILGAKAPWTSSVAATLTGAATIQAADASNAAQDITLSGAIGGTGSLTKTGAGILTLTGTNSYSGNTTVSAGTLSLGTASLANASTVDVATGATLNLNFAGDDIVAGFSIDGVSQATGTWGAVGSGAAHESALITGTGILNVGAADPFADWIDDFAVGGLTAKTDDPDGDGMTNLEEFALDGNPASGVATGKVRSRIETVGADQVLVITLPVRDGATFGGSPSKTATVDDIIYKIDGSNDLNLFDQGVTEIAVSAAGMPTPLSTGWSYHTFRLDGAIGGATPRGPKGFLRATVVDVP